MCDYVGSEKHRQKTQLSAGESLSAAVYRKMRRKDEE
jgi:hypothetical protein